MGNARLPFTIFICSTKQRHQQHRSKGKSNKKRVRLHQQNPKQVDFHKKSVIYWNISKMIPLLSKLCFKRFWTNKQIQMMTRLVRHHHRHHQSLRIFKILKTLMNCNQRRQELSSWQNAKSQIIASRHGTNGPWQK